MHLEEVITSRHKAQFHHLPFDLYRHVSNWVPPLKQHIEKIFDRSLNTHFAHGDAIRFLLFDQNNRVIGRIAAFYNEANTGEKIKAGGTGFFECINNQEAANQLFDACRTWLMAKGFNAMDGPVNFGGRDRWWGLLIEGFDPPVYGMNYHLPYYQQLFEAYGFKNYFEQYTYTLHRNTGMPDMIYRIKERLTEREQVVFQPAEKNNLEKYAADFRTIYNQAWANHEGAEPIDEAQSRAIMHEIKPVMDPSMLLFAYVRGEPAGFFIALPDVNRLLKYAHGNFNLWGKLNVLAHKPFVRMKNLYGIIFGVIPQYQNRGIEAGLAAMMHEMVNKSRYYEQIELLWIGDFNKKMLNFVRHIQAKKYRTLITYRILFDETIPFERCRVIE